MKRDLTKEELLLADAMTAISERCYADGWFMNLEYVLWHAVLRGKRRFGFDMVNQNDIDKLKQLSEQANGWIIYNGEQEHCAIGLKEWESKYDAMVKSDDEVLAG